MVQCVPKVKVSQRQWASLDLYHSTLERPCGTWAPACLPARLPASYSTVQTLPSAQPGPGPATQKGATELHSC